MKDVKYAIEVLGLIDGRDIRRLLDHTDQTLVPCGAGAIGARIYIGDIVANGTKPEIGFHRTNGLRQGFGIFITRSKYMECQPLRAFRANAR